MDRAIELEPYNAEFRCSRGRTHFSAGNLDRALRDLNGAIELDNANSDYLHWRGLFNGNSKHFGKCIV